MGKCSRGLMHTPEGTCITMESNESKPLHGNAIGEHSCSPGTSNDPSSHARENSNLHACELCGKTFTTKHAAKRHRDLHTGEKPYSCESCGKKFIHAFALRRHKRIHKEKSFHSCDYCGKAFNGISDLNAHIRIHTGDKPYSCENCGKRFNHRSNWNRHKRIHTGEKRYTCEYCRKAYGQSGQLKTHMLKYHANSSQMQTQLTHATRKWYSCDYCGKAFDTTFHLKTHLRIHTGEKPFPCEYCGKKFNTKSSLTRHKRRHTGEKPLSCKYCKRTFNQMDDMTVHKCIVDEHSVAHVQVAKTWTEFLKVKNTSSHGTQRDQDIPARKRIYPYKVYHKGEKPAQSTPACTQSTAVTVDGELCDLTLQSEEGTTQCILANRDVITDQEGLIATCNTEGATTNIEDIIGNAEVARTIARTDSVLPNTKGTTPSTLVVDNTEGGIANTEGVNANTEGAITNTESVDTNTEGAIPYTKHTVASVVPNAEGVTPITEDVIANAEGAPGNTKGAIAGLSLTNNASLGNACASQGASKAASQLDLENFRGEVKALFTDVSSQLNQLNNKLDTMMSKVSNLEKAMSAIQTPPSDKVFVFKQEDD